MELHREHFIITRCDPIPELLHRAPSAGYPKPEPKWYEGESHTM